MLVASEQKFTFLQLSSPGQFSLVSEVIELYGEGSVQIMLYLLALSVLRLGLLLKSHHNGWSNFVRTGLLN